ncbi:MAG TPA: hypothetical protein VLK88_15705 [Gemmatimonadales bacterium]|nr:hypothetical protein [Gemmatimonadales bacterium]
MNSRWSRSRVRKLGWTIVAGLIVGCGAKKATGKDSAAKHPADPAQADAEELGRALFDAVDRVMSYRSSHQSKLPNSLRTAGIDSLSPTIVLRYQKSGTSPQVTATFRRTSGRQLASCEGTNDVLEDASLHEGAYTITCTLAGGGSRGFTVGRPSE